MRWIYELTKDGDLMGPGTMFIFASAFYLVAVYFAYLLPVGDRIKLREVPLFKFFSLSISFIIYFLCICESSGIRQTPEGREHV
jgi:hypothetical protein